MAAMMSFQAEKCCHPSSVCTVYPSTFRAAFTSSWSTVHSYLL